MAQILGKHELATKYLGLAEKLWSAFNSVYLAKQPPPAPSAPTTCDESVEIRKGGHPLNLKCESGGVIDKVLAAFMGTPSGSCAHGFARNLSCDAGPSVETAVERLCVGKPSCSLSCAYGKDSPIGVKTDPCQGVIKSLAVSVHCVGGVPAPPPPPPPSPLFGYATPGQLAGQLEQVQTRTVVTLKCHCPMMLSCNITMQCPFDECMPALMQQRTHGCTGGDACTRTICPHSYATQGRCGANVAQ